MSSASTPRIKIALSALAGIGIGFLAARAWPGGETAAVAPPAVVAMDPTVARVEAVQAIVPSAPPRPTRTAVETTAGLTNPLRAADNQRAWQDRLMSEGVSSSWAHFNEGQVEHLLTPGQLASAGVEAPLDYRAECRTTLCRIDLVTSSADAMDAVELHLLQGIAETLGHAQLFHEARPDGTMALVIYARATSR